MDTSGSALAPHTSEPHTPARLLLVEDEALVRDLVREILDVMGYEVVVACDGAVGLDTWRRERERIDLVVTDVVMPRMSGLEAARAMLADDPEVRILFMSGYTDHASFSPRHFGPRAAFVAKPFTTEELGQRVRELLERPRTARAAA